MNLNNFEYAPTNASRTQTRVNVKVRGRSYSRSELASKSGGGPRSFSGAGVQQSTRRMHQSCPCVASARADAGLLGDARLSASREQSDAC